jgi:Bacterial regulatory protein, Fis family
VAIGCLTPTCTVPELRARSKRLSRIYEGWEEVADGHRYFDFGYMNRNWEEELDVPIGPDNTFNVGAADQGQPTPFLPRRNRYVFRVRVPDGFTGKDELIWSLTTKGKTEKAYATLRQDLKIDDIDKASETGALGVGFTNERTRSNKPPSVTREAIVKVLHETRWHKVKAAKRLGLTRSQLYYRIRRYGLE